MWKKQLHAVIPGAPCPWTPSGPPTDLRNQGTSACLKSCRNTIPVVDAEFVEWLNVSGDTLAWGDACWPPDHTLVQATLPKSHFASWIPADVLDILDCGTSKPTCVSPIQQAT